MVKYMKKNLDITALNLVIVNTFCQSLGNSLNRGSTVACMTMYSLNEPNHHKFRVDVPKAIF